MTDSTRRILDLLSVGAQHAEATLGTTNAFLQRMLHNGLVTVGGTKEDRLWSITHRGRRVRLGLGPVRQQG